MSARAPRKQSWSQQNDSDPNLQAAWDTFIERLEFNIEGMEFFADLFSDPENLTGSSTAFEAKGEDFVDGVDELNSKLEQSLNTLMQAQGFEQLDNGSYVVDC